MSTWEILILAATTAGVAAAFAIAVLLRLCLGELRRLREGARKDLEGLRAAAVRGEEQLAETRRGALDAAERVERAFLDADGSFKAMIDALKDIENLQQIKQRADQIADLLIRAHEK